VAREIVTRTRFKSVKVLKKLIVDGKAERVRRFELLPAHW
jgi:hypothetical protein